jgi:hypothetical protein
MVRSPEEWPRSCSGRFPRRATAGRTPLKCREMQMGLGFPPAGLSPAKQQTLGLNKDVTLAPKKG